MTQLQQGLEHIVNDLTARNVSFPLVGGLAVSALTASRLPMTKRRRNCWMLFPKLDTRSRRPSNRLERGASRPHA
ncbi:MAG: hypothetical protein IPL79_18035 [Myxococcales bacterium]|nr:hypothetical protein [Myxococcales bacterium]